MTANARQSLTNDRQFQASKTTKTSCKTTKIGRLQNLQTQAFHGCPAGRSFPSEERRGRGETQVSTLVRGEPLQRSTADRGSLRAPRGFSQETLQAHLRAVEDIPMEALPDPSREVGRGMLVERAVLNGTEHEAVWSRCG